MTTTRTAVRTTTDQNIRCSEEEEEDTTTNDEDWMWAVVTMGPGGYDQLHYRRVRKPIPSKTEVLVQVLAAGINQTDVNTRLDWYNQAGGESSSCPSSSAAIHETTTTTPTTGVVPKDDDGYVVVCHRHTTPFPLIQGTDCCGRVVSAGENEEDSAAEQLIGKRVLIRPCMLRGPQQQGFDDSSHHLWMAYDFDGAFAQFVKVPMTEVFVIEDSIVAQHWTDVELATLPCAYGTAENLLEHCSVTEADHVLITGASGGVGSAAIQLAHRRGARVTALCSQTKQPTLLEKITSAIGNSGAAPIHILPREQVRSSADFLRLLNLASSFQDNVNDKERCPAVTVVIDVVGGPLVSLWISILAPGGRYATCGAIGGPMVTIDLRDLYLKDITMMGCTAWKPNIFPNLIHYITNNEIRPLVAHTYPLSDIILAQEEFLQKRHIGKLVLVPPPLD